VTAGGSAQFAGDSLAPSPGCALAAYMSAPTHQPWKEKMNIFD